MQACERFVDVAALYYGVSHADSLGKSANPFALWLVVLTRVRVFGAKLICLVIRSCG
jgi:hypothetical protein